MNAKLPKLFDVDKVDKAIQRALETVYVNELVLRTPKKTGFVASQWTSHSLGGFNYVITNPKGDIIIFLEEGTKAHPIVPKTKKMLKFPIKEAPKMRNPNEQKTFNKKGIIFFYNKQRRPVLGYVKEGGKYYCFAKKVNHPGFEGQHFIRDILDSNALFSRFKAQVAKNVGG